MEIKLFLYSLVFLKDNFHNNAKKVCQNKVNLSLTFTRRLEYYVHNCKMVY